MEREQRLDDLIGEFKKDNVSKTLPYIWRQRLLWNVVNRLSYEAGTFLALYNALYRLSDPCKRLWFFSMIEFASQSDQNIYNATYPPLVFIR
jgi:hypothetical protein